MLSRDPFEAVKEYQLGEAYVYHTGTPTKINKFDYNKKKHGTVVDEYGRPLHVVAGVGKAFRYKPSREIWMKIWKPYSYRKDSSLDLIDVLGTPYFLVTPKETRDIKHVERTFKNAIWLISAADYNWIPLHDNMILVKGKHGKENQMQNDIIFDLGDGIATVASRFYPLYNDHGYKNCETYYYCALQTYTKFVEERFKSQTLTLFHHITPNYGTRKYVFTLDSHIISLQERSDNLWKMSLCVNKEEQDRQRHLALEEIKRHAEHQEIERRRRMDQAEEKERRLDQEENKERSMSFHQGLRDLLDLYPEVTYYNADTRELRLYTSFRIDDNIFPQTEDEDSSNERTGLVAVIPVEACLYNGFSTIPSLKQADSPFS